jgi:hypothetical protein
MPGVAEVLTPPSIVAAIAAGYRPLVHPSAVGGSSPGADGPPRVRVHPAGPNQACAALNLRLHG